MKHTYNKRYWPLSVSALTEYLSRYPLDCTKHSRQLICDLGDVFRCPIRIGTLVLAALFLGYAVIPHDEGRIFTFCKVAE